MTTIEHHALAVTIETRIRQHGTRHRDRMRERRLDPAFRAQQAENERKRWATASQEARDHRNALARERRARRNPPVPSFDRFFARVDATGDCWIWMGNKPSGYGQLSRDGRPAGAHRVAYELLVGRREYQRTYRARQKGMAA